MCYLIQVQCSIVSEIRFHAPWRGRVAGISIRLWFASTVKTILHGSSQLFLNLVQFYSVMDLCFSSWKQEPYGHRYRSMLKSHGTCLENKCIPSRRKSIDHDLNRQKNCPLKEQNYRKYLSILQQLIVSFIHRNACCVWYLAIAFLICKFFLIVQINVVFACCGSFCLVQQNVISLITSTVSSSIFL